jgi:hypothetical protein
MNSLSFLPRYVETTEEGTHMVYASITFSHLSPEELRWAGSSSSSSSSSHDPSLLQQEPVIGVYGITPGVPGPPPNIYPLSLFFS